MTTTLLKYILRGALKGIEDYEAMLDKECFDPRGKMADILGDVSKELKPAKGGAKSKPKKPEVKMDPSSPIDLDEFLS